MRGGGLRTKIVESLRWLCYLKKIFCIYCSFWEFLVYGCTSLFDVMYLGVEKLLEVYGCTSLFDVVYLGGEELPEL